MNEYVGYSEPDKQYNVELVFSFSLYMYHSYIFFSFKRKQNCDNRQRTKRIQQKKIYSNVEDNSLPTVSD